MAVQEPTPTAEPARKPDIDQGGDTVADIQKQVDKDEERGYRGHVFDPYPNEAYSLLTGPDGPPVNEPFTPAKPIEH